MPKQSKSSVIVNFYRINLVTHNNYSNRCAESVRDRWNAPRDQQLFVTKSRLHAIVISIMRGRAREMRRTRREAPAYFAQ